MSTRFYLEYNQAASVTPASWASNWNYQNGTVGTYKATTVAAGTTITALSHTNDSSASASFGARVRFVSGQLEAQTLSGTIKGQVQCSENSTSNNATIAIAILVIGNDGTVKYTLLQPAASDDTSTAPPELASSRTNRRLQDSSESASITLGSYGCAQGDRLVIELGVREVRNTGTESLYIGSTASAGDLGENDTDTTTTHRPWVEFSGTFSFYTPPPKYGTVFPTVENPLRDTGVGDWLNGGSDSPAYWEDCRVSAAGFCRAAQAGGVGYDDPNAMVGVAHAADQWAWGKVVNTIADSGQGEIEIHLRKTYGSGTIACYELLYPIANGSPSNNTYLVRWNATDQPPNAYFDLLQEFSNLVLTTGMKIGGKVVGDTIYLYYYDGTEHLLGSFTDSSGSKLTSGKPGIGFAYQEGGGYADYTEYGFSAFKSGEGETIDWTDPSSATTYTKTVTVSGVVQKTATKTTTVDALLGAATVKPVTVTAVLSKTSTKVVTVSAVVGSGAGGSYGTLFPTVQNPISEGGKWLSGGRDGSAWGDVYVSSAGFARGTDGNQLYGDPTALVNMTFANDQWAWARVVNNLTGSYTTEIEIRLRCSMTSNSCAGYECLFQLSNQGASGNLVSWTGPIGTFTIIGSDISSLPSPFTTGMKIGARIQGNTVYFYYYDGTEHLLGSRQDTNSLWSSGKPGIGFNYPGSPTHANYGFSAFKAGEGTTIDWSDPVGSSTNTKTVTCTAVLTRVGTKVTTVSGVIAAGGPGTFTKAVYCTAVLQGAAIGTGNILSVGAPDARGQFAVVVEGDVSAKVGAQDQVYAGGDLVGTVLQATYEAGTGTTLWTQLLPGRTTVDETWVDRPTAVGQFTEVMRLRRATSTAVVSWLDTDVAIGEPYEYAIQAFGLFDESALSPLSEIRYVSAGDVTAPGSIAITAGYPKVINGQAIVKFTAPSDSDYAGVRVYYRSITDTGTATGGGASTLQDTAKTWITSTLANKWVRLLADADPQYGVIQDNTNDTLTVYQPWRLNPSSGSTYTVFSYPAVLTDYGKPAAGDEIRFTPLGYGVYEFRTFDRAGNEQVMWDGGVTWDYQTGQDTFTTSNQAPVVGIRQLTNAEQVGPPGITGYTDTLNYVVLELSASHVDPLTGQNTTANVTIEYRRRGDTNFMSGLPASAAGFGETYLVDQPPTARTRLVALSRGPNENYLHVRAVESIGGLYSDLITYTADYDTFPEISTVDSRLDTSNDLVHFDGAVDDDGGSLKWWLDGAEVGTGEPTESAPDTTSFPNLTSIKTFSGIFSLASGKKKTLHLQPYSAPNCTGLAGAVYEREWVRSPQTIVTLEPRNEDGQMSSTVMKMTLQCSPGFMREESGTSTGGNTATTLVDVNKTWIADMWLFECPSHLVATALPAHYVQITGGTGAEQVRRITDVDGVAKSLTVDPAWTTTPDATSVYEIYNGATLWQVNGEAWQAVYQLFQGVSLPALPKPIYRPREDGLVLRFYSELSGIPAETEHSLTIDENTMPSLTAITAVENTANILDISLQGYDDDTKRWLCYARRGAWPTLDGSEGGWPDQAYKRFEGPPTVGTFSMAANTGDWYLKAIGEGSLNDLATDAASSATVHVTVVGTGQNQPVLTSVTGGAHDDGSAAYNQLTWNHNTHISGTTGLKIFAYREDLGQGTETELTGGTARDPRKDVGSNWDNSDDTDVTSGQGSYLHALSETRDAAGVYRNWKYRLELYENSSLVATYYYNLPGYFVTPNLVSVNRVVSHQGTSSSDRREQTFSWVPNSAVSDSAHRIQIWYRANGPDQGTWDELSSPILPSLGQQAFTVYAWWLKLGTQRADEYRWDLRTLADVVLVSGDFSTDYYTGPPAL